MMIFAGLTSLFLQRHAIFLSVCLREVHLMVIKLEILMEVLFLTYVVGSKSFRPDQLFKVTEIKQLCYFST